MGLKQTKVFVPTDVLGNEFGYVKMPNKNAEPVKEVELFTLTQEELKRVIGDAVVHGKFFTTNLNKLIGEKELSFEEHKAKYINQILK